MLKEKLISVMAGLGEVLDRQPDDSSAEIIRACRRNLASAAEQADAMEKGLAVMEMESDGLELTLARTVIIGRNLRVNAVVPREMFKEML